MQPTLETRKPVDSLDEIDLLMFPVWEFAIDEEGDDQREDQDETWVRPVDAKVSPQGEYSLIVAAKFLTSSGPQFPGLMIVSTTEGVEFLGGAILQKNEYIIVSTPVFWNANEDNEKLVAALGMSKSEVFPLSFKLEVRIDGETSHRVGEFNA